MKVKIHPSSDVQTDQIGCGTNIWQFCVILPGAKIGQNCNICSHCFLENDVIIGNNVTIKNGVFLWDGIVVEDDVQIGPNVSFTNDKYPRAKQPFVLQRTLIKRRASIGAGSIILGGIIIGESSLVGAGSVVTKNIPDFTIWYGNPAKIKGYITKTGQILDINLRDKEGNQYLLIKNEPVLINS
jgi:acetyltransferase-like isoleucine patch superfamily enzyme